MNSITKDSENMNGERNLLVGIGGVSVTRAPTTMPTTESGSEFQILPLKFTLMGLQNDIPRISEFRSASLSYIKGMLALVSIDVDGLKITDVKEQYIDTLLNDRRDLSITRSAFSFANGTSSYALIAEEEVVKDHTRVFNLYYEATAVVADPNKLYGPLLIDIVQNRHSELLQQIQQYKATQYYYAADFDLCTTASGKKASTDRSFDLCSQDHQLVSIKFGLTSLPEDMNRDAFKYEVINIYQDILKSIDGIQMTGFYEDRIEDVGQAQEFYFDVKVVKRNRDYSLIINNELNSQDGKMEVLNRIQSYTNEEGRDIEWCITELGRFSPSCVAVATTARGMPEWAIITIAVASALIVFGLLIWILLIAYQRDREQSDFRESCRKYVADPQDLYRTQATASKPQRHRNRIHIYRDENRRRMIYYRPSRNHRRREDRRRKNHRRRDRRPRRSHRPRRERQQYFDSVNSDLYDTVETLPDFDNEYQMVLYEEPAEPQQPFPRRELLQLPPPPRHQMEGQFRSIQQQQHMQSQRDILRIEPERPARRVQLRHVERNLSQEQREMLRIEALHQSRQQLDQPRILAQPRHHQSSPYYPRHEQELLRIEQDPVYCDDNFVNRPDPPTFNRRC